MLFTVEIGNQQKDEFEAFLNENGCDWWWDDDEEYYEVEDKDAEAFMSYLDHHNINYDELEYKDYRVIVAETQYYEIHLTARSKEDAEDIALEEYGCDGDIFSTQAEVTLIEEE